MLGEYTFQRKSMLIFAAKVDAYRSEKIVFRFTVVNIDKYLFRH